MANGTWYYQKIHAKQILRANSIQAVLNANTEFNLSLKLSDSSVQTVLIRECCQRYHSKHDLMLSENLFQILLNVIRKFMQSAVRIQSKQHLLLFEEINPNST